MPLSKEGDDESARKDWFYEQRAYPLQTIPWAARDRALRQADEETSKRKRFSAAVSTEAVAQEALSAWTPLGPAPIGNGSVFGIGSASVSGRVTALALDPGYNGTSNQTVYVGAAQGGVWRSRDNGANWTPLIDDQPSLAVGAIAVDPTNPNVIYVGTGEGNLSSDSYYGAGLLKSIDGGATWAQITGPVSTSDPQVPAFLNATFLKIVVDPTSPSTIYACTAGFGSSTSASGGANAPALGQRGVWKSNDGGQTWRNLDPSGAAGSKSATDLVIDPANPARVFAAVYKIGLYRSNQGGEPGSWENLSGGLPGSGFTRIALAAGPAVPPSASPTLYAAYASSDSNANLLGIYQSTDGGTTWRQVTSPTTSGQNDYNLTLAVDPVDGNTVYFGTSANKNYSGGTVVRSRDGGQTWGDISRGNGTGGLHVDHHAIVISPSNRNTIFVGNDGGVWRTDNALGGTVGWTSLNQTLSITQFQSVALHPADPNLLIGGTQDNGTNLFSGKSAWLMADDGDGGFALIDQANPKVMYHTYYNESAGASGKNALIGPVISTDGGNSWSSRMCDNCTAQPGGFNPKDRVGFYAPMALHTGFTSAPGGNIIYFGTHRLYRSANQGLDWTGLGASTDGFGADLTKGTGRLSAIAAHPVLGGGSPPAEVVWVGTSDGLVQVTTNAGALAGATWNNVTKAPLPNRFVTDLALDPANQQRAFVTYSGFNTNTPDAPGHVFATTNQGATWANISGNLPDVPVNSITVDPTRAGTLYIGTDIGVFQTTDSGATWVALSNGLPKVAVFMIRYHAATGNLVAATHGRGVYRLATGLQSTRPLASVSAASFQAAALAAEGIAAAYGTGLATTTQAATAVPLPTSLAGTQVVVKDSTGVERLAPLFFVSPGQVNYLIPAGTLPGTATVTVTASDGTVSSGAVQISATSPGLFAANANGQGAAAAVALRVRADNSESYEPIAQFDAAQNKFVTTPLDLGPATDQVFLILYGTGIRSRADLSTVSASVGGASAQVLFAGPQGGFVGLDQVNLRVPRSLVGRGEVDITLTVDGKAANTVRVNIR